MADILSLQLDNLLPTSPPNPALLQSIQQTQSIITPSRFDPSLLPTTLHDLLTQIIKPLFTTQHPKLTPSGRKLLVPPQAPLPHSSPISSFLAPQPWENPLTIPLLTSILHTYPSLPATIQRSTFEAHFPLLIPPILNIIDHHSTPAKAEGYHLLRLLCEACAKAESGALRRSGLTEVFVESLRTGFGLLPSLTPEEESLTVLAELYPSFFAVLEARFVELTRNGDVGGGSGAGNAKEANGESHRGQEKETFKLTPEKEARVKLLTLLLRHGVLHSLSHLATGTSTSYVMLTTFLLCQLRLTITAMGVFAVRDLNVILPMMRGVLSDPFGTAAVGLIMEALGVLKAVIDCCAERVAERWWGEVLRGLVGGWCVVLDEEGVEEGQRRGNEKKVKEREELKMRLKGVAKALGGVVKKDEWDDARRRLVEEEEGLVELFDGT